jgi:hypothetical protein
LAELAIHPPLPSSLPSPSQHSHSNIFQSQQHIEPSYRLQLNPHLHDIRYPTVSHHLFFSRIDTHSQLSASSRSRSFEMSIGKEVGQTFNDFVSGVFGGGDSGSESKGSHDEQGSQQGDDAAALSSSAAAAASSLSSQAASIASSASAQAASVASSVSAQAASVASSVSAQAASVSSVQAASLSSAQAASVASSISAQVASLSSAQAQFSLQAQPQAAAVAAPPVVAAQQQPARVTVYAPMAQGPAVVTASAVQQLNSVAAVPVGNSIIASAAPVEESAAVIAPPVEESAADATSPLQEQGMIAANGSTNGSTIAGLRRRAGPRRQNAGTASLSIWRVVSTLGAFSTTTFAAAPRNNARSIDPSPNSQSTPVQIVRAVSVEPATSSMASIPSQVGSGLLDNLVEGVFGDFYEEPDITTSKSVPSAPVDDSAALSPDDDHDTSSPTHEDTASHSSDDFLLPNSTYDDGSNHPPRSAPDVPTTLATVVRKRTPDPSRGKDKAPAAAPKAASSVPKASAQASKPASSGKPKAAASSAAKAGSKASSAHATPAVSASASAAAKSSPAPSSSAAKKGGLGGFLNADNAKAAGSLGKGLYDGYKGKTDPAAAPSAAPDAAPEPSQAGSAFDPEVTLDPNDDQMWADDTVGVPPAEGGGKKGAGKAPSPSASAGAQAASPSVKAGPHKGGEDTNVAAGSASSQGTAAGATDPNGGTGSGSAKASDSADPKGKSGSGSAANPPAAANAAAPAKPDAAGSSGQTGSGSPAGSAGSSSGSKGSSRAQGSSGSSAAKGSGGSASSGGSKASTNSKASSKEKREGTIDEDGNPMNASEAAFDKVCDYFKSQGGTCSVSI